MKILVLSNTSALADSVTLPEIQSGADSALLSPGQPLFLPDHLGQWRSQICPAIRICRLGMNIPEKSARAHYNAFTAVHILRPAGTTPPDAAIIMDRAFAHGEWLDEIPETITIETEAEPLPGFRGVLPPHVSASARTDSLMIDRSIASISRFATLKTGDILIFADLTTCTMPLIDTRMLITINGIQTLSLKIK